MRVVVFFLTFRKRGTERAKMLYSAITTQIFQEINLSGKITCSRRKKKNPPGVAATRQLGGSLLLCRQCKYDRRIFSRDQTSAAAPLDKCTPRRQFLLSSGGNVAPTAFYFYQALYVARSSAEPFLKLSGRESKRTADG